LIGLRWKHQYVVVARDVEVSDEDFKDQFEALNEELETLNEQARGLENPPLPRTPPRFWNHENRTCSISYHHL
jgi:hypothetical protein